MEEVKGQRKTAEIDRGLFLLRYAEAENDVAPPKVQVYPGPGSDGNIGFILHPDATEAVLWRPGSCLVIRASAAGRLTIEVVPTRPNGSTAATIKIEALTQGTPARRAAETEQRTGSALDLDEFRVLGHVAGIGDVVANANQWIAGPSAPSRIEGVALEWPSKPADLDVRYAVRHPGPQTGMTQMVNLGAFAGTRGRALPITGVVFEMSGQGSSGCELCAEAVFLGSPGRRVTGKRVVLAGPTGREPLVGLRLNVQSAAQANQPEPEPARPTRPSSGRVRVFRSRAKQND